MRRIFVFIIISIFFITYYAQAILVPVPSLITRTVLASPTAKNIAMRVTSAATGAVLGWLVVEGYKANLNTNILEGNNIKNSNLELINDLNIESFYYNGSMFTFISEYIPNVPAFSYQDSDGNRRYFSCNPSSSDYKPYVVHYSSSNTIYFRICMSGITYTYKAREYGKSSMPVPIDEKPLNADIKFTTSLNENIDYEIPPYPLFADLGVQGIVDGVNTGLSSAGSDVIVSKDDILPLLPHLPKEFVDEIKNKSSALDNQLIESSVQNVADTIKTETYDISISDIPIPESPLFDVNIEIPEQVDFLSPVKSFFNNVLNSIPFISLFNEANIEVSSISSEFSFNVFGESVTFDFNEYHNVFSFMSSVIIFCASVFAVMIIVM